MALNPTTVIKTYDYYNTLTLVPGYSAQGYPDENNIARAQYSTDFSSNPIGSKVDFFTHLNDPCIAIVAPQPVFTITKPLSALSPQWFNGYWDQAMFYSHPLVTKEISANYPNVYQNFSDSVGTITYTPTVTDPTSPSYGNDPFSSALNFKIPSSINSALNKLNNDLNNLQSGLDGYLPKAGVLSKATFLSQVLAHQQSSGSLQLQLAGKYGSLAVKLPFNTNLTGNLQTPPAWSTTQAIEGINSTVNTINDAIKTPGRLLSEALIKIKSLIPKITLPSIGKLTGLNIPNPIAITNVISQITQYASAAKSALTQAQAVVAAAQQGVASIENTINSETAQITSVVNTVSRIAASPQSFNAVVDIGGTTVGLQYQSPSTLSGLTNNKAIIIPGNTVNAAGNPSVISVTTLQNTKVPNPGKT